MKDIVNKLTEMNNNNELGADNLRPVVEYRVTDHYSEKMLTVADEMQSLGMNEATNRITRQVGLIKAGSKAMLTELGRVNVEKAQHIERDMVGHGRSGYQPTGNLMRSINAYTLSDGRVQVYPNAEAKGGTEYGGFVEYGTRKHPTPEPFMEQSNKEMKTVIDHQTTALLKGVGL